MRFRALPAFLPVVLLAPVAVAQAFARCTAVRALPPPDEAVLEARREAAAGRFDAAEIHLRAAIDEIAARGQGAERPPRRAGARGRALFPENPPEAAVDRLALYGAELSQVAGDADSYARRDPARVRDLARQLLAFGEKHCHPGAQAAANQAMGRVRYWDAFRTGRFEEARPHFTRALEMRASLGDTAAMADSRFYLGLIEQMQGRAAAAMAHFRQSLSWAEQAADPVLQSYAVRHVASLQEDGGALDEAEKGYRRSLALREQAGARVLVPFARLTLADFLETHRAASAEAIRLTRRAVREAREAGSLRALVSAEIALSRRLQTAGCLPEARDHARAAVEAARQFGDPEPLAEARKELSRLGRVPVSPSACESPAP